jgi:hypothetical protein
MRIRTVLLMIVLGLLCLEVQPRPANAGLPAMPDVFASPINAGCVQVAPSACKLHVDPFTIQVSSGQRLAAFQLQANGQLLYDYRTDVSNPPLGNFTPSPVRLDFAATCGHTYTVNLLARDTGDSSFLNAGQAEDIACPVGTFTHYLPVIKR